MTNKTPKECVMAIGKQIRKVESETAKLHAMCEKYATVHADLLGLNESEGDFQAMSGGGDKDGKPQ